ncbi:MAG TPA: hypothetical protein PKI14_07190 [Fervidobacterium sp.]|nr:hypothetical protein [Fervidobacterium sp.]
MTVARREHFGKLLEPGLRKIFYEEFNQLPSMIPELYNVQSTSNPWEEDVSIGTLGEFPEFRGTVEYDRMYEGYSTVYSFPEFAKGFQIERKLFDDQRYAIIKKQPKGLAMSAFRRRESDAAYIFNNAFTHVGSDGVPLVSDAHPSPAPDGPPARSNIVSWKLGHDALRATHLMGRAFVDDRGGKIETNFDTLIVPPDLEEIGWSIITADGRLEATHPGTHPNIHKGKYKLVVWDYLTNPDVWFLADSRMMKMYLNWFDRVPLEFAMTEDFDTMVAKYRAYMRYGFGFSDWIWVIGSTGEEEYSTSAAEGNG